MDLTPIQKQEKRELREAYAQFWTNNAAFKRGWARPVAQFDEVREFLDEIAEYVVLLRNQLDSQTGTPAIRSPKAGAATEYLWTMEYNPVQEKERFVKDMVLATFSDANGYVEGLTEERILKHIQECKDKKKKAFESLRNNLSDAFQRFDAKIKGVLNQKHAISQKEATVIQKIIDAMNNFSNQLTVEEQPQAAPTPTPAVPAEESMRQESERKEQDELLRTISELNKERLRKEAEAVEQELKQAQAEQEKILKEKESQGLIQIEQVAHDVEGLKSNVHSLATDTEALDVESLLKDPTEGIKTIDTLERKCLTYTEELLKDLSTLDQVMGSEQTRPLRKQQVHSVQELMKEIDQVNEKLHGVMYQLKQEQHQREQEHLLQQGKIPEELKEGEQKKEETKNEEPKEAPKKLKTVIGRTPDGRAVVVEMTPEEQQQLEKLIAEEIEEIQRQQQAKEEMGEEVTDGDEAKRKKQKQEETTALPSDQVEDMETSKGWEDLILHPRFETQDHPLFFVLASYIPGMRQDDLSIQFSRNTGMLSVKGMRIPTPEEIEAMKKQVKTMHTLDPKGIYFPIDEDEETSLKRVGAGRYGTFQQSFRIPKGLHPEKMVATYNGGVLQILLPKDQALKKSKKPNKKNFDIYSTPLPIYNDKEMWWQ